VFGLWKLIFTYFLLIHTKFLIDVYVSRSYWFWSSNSVFGLWKLIFTFLTPKSIYLLHIYIYIYIPIDGYVTRKYWFWAPNSVFGLWRRLIFAFLTSKSIFFLTTCKIPDWWIRHTTILILGYEGLTFLTPKVYVFLTLCKTPDRESYAFCWLWFHLSFCYAA
jgi:hypothetical protein